MSEEKHKYYCDGCIDYQDGECKADMDTRFMENSCYRSPMEKDDESAS